MHIFWNGAVRREQHLPPIKMTSGAPPHCSSELPTSRSSFSRHSIFLACEFGASSQMWHALANDCAVSDCADSVLVTCGLSETGIS